MTLLQQLRARWPETDNYLDQVGQQTNDLMVARELQAASMSAPAWMERLAIEPSDLLKAPTAVAVMRYLYQKLTVVQEARTILEYQEAVTEYESQRVSGEHSFFSPLEDPDFTLTEKSDLELWALPQLQEELQNAMNLVQTRFAPKHPPLTFEQSVILLRLVLFLDQEPNMSEEWAAESVQSLLSEPFFKSAGSQPAAS